MHMPLNLNMEMNIPPADVEALRKELDEAKSRRKRLRIMMHLSFHLRVLDPERSLELGDLDAAIECRSRLTFAGHETRLGDEGCRVEAIEPGFECPVASDL